jgi:endoglycosylceramidase
VVVRSATRTGRRAAGLLAIGGLLAAAPAAGGATAPQPLRSVRGSAPAIVDAAGRHVLLRGVNVNQLGDYYQDNPALAPVVPLTEADFAAIARLGFNSVRLIVHWSALEPTPGKVDAAYVARVRQAVDWARKYGLYVVLDMHQDAWGKYIASPPGVMCPPSVSPPPGVPAPPSFVPAIGWDGAPQWATITDGMTTCRVQLREVSPAVAQAFTNFYADRPGPDGVGIQTHLLHTWATLVREFAADPTIAGYDLLNEPHPGYTPGPAAATVLGAFYGKAISAIRTAESSVPGGFSHIAFFEPNVTWSGIGTDAVPPPGFTLDDNIVFAPHLYAGSITADRAVGISAVSIDQGFQFAAAAAATYGTTVWSGEWGWFGNPAGDAPSISEYARQEDANLFGGAWWQWRQACGDPHSIGSPGNTPTGVSGNLNLIKCPQGTPLAMPASTRRILSRPYVWAAPGRLTQMTSDPPTGDLTVRGTDTDPAGSCQLDIWVPDGRPGTPRFVTTNVRNVTATRVDGGWRVSGCASAAYSLRRVDSAEEVAIAKQHELQRERQRQALRPVLRVSISPQRVAAGRSVQFSLRVMTPAKGGRGAQAVAGATIRFAGASATTDRRGRARIRARLRTRGRYRARASKRGYNAGTAYVRAVHARRSRLKSP